jgi:hypothetical protein
MISNEGCDLDTIHRKLVQPLKKRCEEHVKFCNKCCDEFYKIQMTPLKECVEKEEEIKLFKIKIDLLHQIKIKRFIEYKGEMKNDYKFLQIKESINLQHLKQINKFMNLLRVHPKYKEFWLERMEDSYLFDCLKFQPNNKRKKKLTSRNPQGIHQTVNFRKRFLCFSTKQTIGPLHGVDQNN